MICLTTVYQEDCSQQDLPPDEAAHWSADLDDLDDLDIKLKDQGAEEVTDGMTPASHYLSPSRSHSHLSRIDTHRVMDTTSYQFHGCSMFGKAFSVKSK